MKMTVNFDLNDVLVNIRRQTSETVCNSPLGDELRYYLEYAYPNWRCRLISNGLEFNHKKLKIEGIPEVAKEKLEEERKGLAEDDFQELLKSNPELKELNSWMKKAFGDLDEFKVQTVLWHKFYNKPGLLITGFIENSLGNLLPPDVNLSKENKLLWSILSGVDLSQLENDAKIWLQTICGDSSCDIIDKKSLKTALNALESVKIKGIEKTDLIDLKSALGKKFKKYTKIPFSEIIQFLLNQVTIKRYKSMRNQEYDLMYFSKGCSACVHFEVKSCKHQSILRKRYTEAKDQLLSGENFFKDVISPLSDLLDDWRYFGFVCFPEVENKDILRKLTYDDGIFFTEERLKNILTKEELEDSSYDWWNQLELQEKSQFSDKENGCYTTLASVLLGSLHIHRTEQTFNKPHLLELEPESKRVQETSKRLGLPMDKSLSHISKNNKFTSLQGKPLGHADSILFWSKQQKEIMICLDRGISTLILGDYGCGKTLLLEAIALSLAALDDTDVYFISALDYVTYQKKYDDVLDIALRLKLQDKCQFYSIPDLKEMFRESVCSKIINRIKGVITRIRDTNTFKPKPATQYQTELTLNLLQKFVRSLGKRSSNSVIILDELSLSRMAKKRIIEEGDECYLVNTLQKMKESCKMVWAVVSTSGVADTSDNANNMIPLEQLNDILSLSGYHMVTLKNVMRNSHCIFNATTQESLNRYNVLESYNITPSITVGESSTVLGTKPTIVLYPYPKDNNNDYKQLSACVEKYYKDIKVDLETEKQKEMIEKQKEIQKLANRKDEESGLMKIKLSNDMEEIKNRIVRIAVLCLYDLIEPRKLFEHLKIAIDDVALYDAGISIFVAEKPSYIKDKEDDIHSDKSVVENWLIKGGTLITHHEVFKGCEADVVILVTRNWGRMSVMTLGQRSAATRGVAHACIVMSEYEGLKEQELSKHFNIQRI